MKKCMICGWEDGDDSAFTCPACGEASWLPLEAKAEVPAVEAVEAPVKRGPGRPRKTS
jgi:hypothetical protein